jgi:hypothetical protein
MKVEEWVDHTHDLIEAAFDKTEALRFTSNRGYTDEELLGFKPPPKMPRPRFLDDKYLVTARLKRLDELILKMHLLNINPDFVPQEWQYSPTINRRFIVAAIMRLWIGSGGLGLRFALSRRCSGMAQLG